MPRSDAFAFQRSGLSDFLFAPVGIEANGMTLSVVSVFARLGDDPWAEAGRLAGLPKSEATASLARSIASMPTSIWPPQAATAIATGLIALLPASVGRPSPAAPVAQRRTSPRHFLRIGVVLVCVATVLAFEVGLIPSFDEMSSRISSIAGTATPQR
ncbi:MAG: hypothetical protein WDN25_30965 [Acetobacteraceae bacterium]